MSRPLGPCTLALYLGSPILLVAWRDWCLGKETYCIPPKSSLRISWNLEFISSGIHAFYQSLRLLRSCPETFSDSP